MGDFFSLIHRPPLTAFFFTAVKRAPRGGPGYEGRPGYEARIS